MTGNKVPWNLLDLLLVYGAALFLVQPWLLALCQFWWPASSDPLVQFVMSTCSQYGALVLMIGLALLWRRASGSDLGLRSLSGRALGRYGIGGGLALIALMMLLGLLIAWLNPGLEGQPFAQTLVEGTTWQHFLVTFLAGVVLAPFMEEIYFRGMVYTVFRQHLGVKWGIVVAGLLFGLIHADLWRALPLSLGGMGLCYIYEKTQSIWASTLAHSLWNGVMYACIVLPLLFN